MCGFVLNCESFVFTNCLFCLYFLSDLNLVNHSMKSTVVTFIIDELDY